MNTYQKPGARRIQNKQLREIVEGNQWAALADRSHPLPVGLDIEEALKALTQLAIYQNGVRFGLIDPE